MAKNFLLVIAAFAIAAAVNAQSVPKTMYVWGNEGTILYEELVSLIDSVTFYKSETPEPECPPITADDYVEISNVKWAKRNLGIGGNFVANTTDYGALFQWGRRADGHEDRESERYPEESNNGVVDVSELDAYGQIPPGHDAYSKFIRQFAAPVDWRTPQDNTLWNAGNETTPVKSANDPCPCGWRLPTATELESLFNTCPVWHTIGDINGHLFDGEIFLPAGGARMNNAANINGTNTVGYYWSSGIDTETSLPRCLLLYTDEQLDIYSHYRAVGLSVRCVVEE